MEILPYLLHSNKPPSKIYYWAGTEWVKAAAFSLAFQSGFDNGRKLSWSLLLFWWAWCSSPKYCLRIFNFLIICNASNSMSKTREFQRMQEAGVVTWISTFLDLFNIDLVMLLFRAVPRSMVPFFRGRNPGRRSAFCVFALGSTTLLRKELKERLFPAPAHHVIWSQPARSGHSLCQNDAAAWLCGIAPQLRNGVGHSVGVLLTRLFVVEVPAKTGGGHRVSSIWWSLWRFTQARLWPQISNIGIVDWAQHRGHNILVVFCLTLQPPCFAELEQKIYEFPGNLILETK